MNQLRALAMKALCFYEKGKIGACQENCAKILRSQDFDVEAYRSIAAIYWDLEDYNQCIAVCRDILVRFARDERAHWYIMHCLVKLRNSSEARNAIEEGVAIFGNDPEFLNDAALCMEELGDPKSAVGILTGAAELAPNSARVWTNLGRLYLGLNDHKQAATHFDRALVVDRKWSGALMGLAQLSYRLGNYQEALDLCNEVLREKQESVDVLRLKAEVLDRLEQWEGALECNTEIDRTNALEQRTLWRMGFCQGELGQHKEAVAAFDKAITAGLDEAYLWQRRGDDLFHCGEFSCAVESYEQALKREPQNSKALGNKGSALNALGLTEEARQCLEKAIKLDPSNTEALANLGYMNVEEGKLRRGMELIEQALQINPNHEHAWK